jgi:hypothetical protein
VLPPTSEVKMFSSALCSHASSLYALLLGRFCPVKNSEFAVYLMILVYYILTESSIARQQLGKHCLKAGIAAEAEVNLQGNGSLAHVPAATNINKDIPVTTNRITEDN